MTTTDIPTTGSTRTHPHGAMTAEGPPRTSSARSLEVALDRSRTLEAALHQHPGNHRVLTGDRPTGELHIGHYIGTLVNRVRLQNLGVPTFIVIADYQVITDRDAVGPVRERVRGLLADYLAVGIDPAKTVIFPHSAIPALNQLLVPFLSLVTAAELARNPTVKAEHADASRPLGALLLTYPVHQAADILSCGGTVVPVGRDQLPHVEVTRTIARRFNERYGPVFAEPEALLSDAPTILGPDGGKMSKSRGNAITLSADPDRVAGLIKGARTDSERLITFEPERRPGVANLLTIAAALAGRDPVSVAAEIGDDGSAGLKRHVTDIVNDRLRPIRIRRAELIGDPGYLDGVLLDGIAAMTAVAGETLDRVRAAMGMDYLR
jgi:tryptophanyl-tRNA synthetase